MRRKEEGKQAHGEERRNGKKARKIKERNGMKEKGDGVTEMRGTKLSDGNEEKKRIAPGKVVREEERKEE